MRGQLGVRNKRIFFTQAEHLVRRIGGGKHFGFTCITWNHRNTFGLWLFKEVDWVRVCIDRVLDTEHIQHVERLCRIPLGGKRTLDFGTYHCVVIINEVKLVVTEWLVSYTGSVGVKNGVTTKVVRLRDPAVTGTLVECDKVYVLHLCHHCFRKSIIDNPAAARAAAGSLDTFSAVRCSLTLRHLYRKIAPLNRALLSFCFSFGASLLIRGKNLLSFLTSLTSP